MATATYPSSYPSYSSVHTDVDIEKALGDGAEFDGQAMLRAGFVRSVLEQKQLCYLAHVCNRLTQPHTTCACLSLQRWTASSSFC
jgi:hypothetical protein